MKNWQKIEVQRADNTLHLGHTDLDTMELDLAAWMF